MLVQHTWYCRLLGADYEQLTAVPAAPAWRAKVLFFKNSSSVIISCYKVTLSSGPLPPLPSQHNRHSCTADQTTSGGEVLNKKQGNVYISPMSIIHRRRVRLTCIPTTTGRAAWLSSACAWLNGSPFLPLPPPPRPAECFGLVLQWLQRGNGTSSTQRQHSFWHIWVVLFYFTGNLLYQHAVSNSWQSRYITR